MATGTATIAANWFTFTYTPNVLFGTATIGGTFNPPSLPSMDLTWGTGEGQFNLIGLASGVLTNVTPGTTDTANIDLKALVDPAGVAVTTMVKLVAAFFMNFAQDDVSYLTVGPGAANPFTSMFSGTGGVIVPPAHRRTTNNQWTYGMDSRIGAGPSAYAVATGNKTIKLTSGSSVSLPYRAIFLGRTA